ncbi:uncharacterized protein LOC142350007 isoform X2 [Convolutriloba macropyga]|uniref:uncharacterized protein LOC142350007 isoform X2 n=1 Tax=Convolutriloba macropyga TaxID=536237 RepID=UPI003F522C0C
MENSGYPAASADIPAFSEQFYTNIITEEDITSAFADHVIDESCCCFKPDNPANDTSIKEFTTYFLLRYELLSYVEERSFETRREPIPGLYYNPLQHLNRYPDNNLWAYDLRPEQEWWKGDKTTPEVGRTYERCQPCDGRGRDECFFCNGSGNNEEGGQCFQCGGRGYKECFSCRGVGMRSVVHEVKAEYKIKDDYHFEGKDVDVPEGKLEDVTGISLFNFESYPPIAPMPNYAESATLNEAAMKLLKEHYDKYMMKNQESKRVLKQKHSLMSIPVTKADVVYKEKDLVVWIYGSERKVRCTGLSTCSIL